MVLSCFQLKISNFAVTETIQLHKHKKSERRKLTKILGKTFQNTIALGLKTKMKPKIL